MDARTSGNLPFTRQRISSCESYKRHGEDRMSPTDRTIRPAQSGEYIARIDDLYVAPL